MIPISSQLDNQIKKDSQQVTPQVKAWIADLRYLTNIKYNTTSHSYDKQITDRLPLSYVKFDEIQRNIYVADGVNRVKDFGSLGFDIGYGNSTAGVPAANSAVLPLVYQGPEKAVEYYEPKRLIDTFNRTNSASLGFMTTLGSVTEDSEMSMYSWRVGAASGRHWGISGNTAYSYEQVYSPTTPTVMYTDTQGLDHYVDFKIGTGSNSLLGGFAVFLRYIDNNNFIAVHITNPTNVADSMRIIQRKNGVDTTLSTVGSSIRFNTTNYYRFRMFVNTIYVYDMGTTEPVDATNPSSTIFTAYVDDPYFRSADATKVGIGNIAYGTWNPSFTASSYDYHTYIDYFACKGKRYTVGAHQFPNASYCFASTALPNENTAAKFAKLQALNNFSISFLMQAYSGGSAVQTIYWLGDSAQLTAIQVSFLNPSGKIRVKVISTTTTYTLTTTTALTIDGITFYYIGVTKNGTELSVTINGTKDATTVTVPSTLSLKVLGATPYMVFGGDYTGVTLGDAAGYHLYNGLISSFAIFDYALTTEDYQNIRNSVENGGTSPIITNDTYCTANRVTDGFEEETKRWLFTNHLSSDGIGVPGSNSTYPPDPSPEIRDNYSWMSRTQSNNVGSFSTPDYIKISFDAQMTSKFRVTTGYEMGALATFSWEAYVPSTNNTLSGTGNFAGNSYVDISLPIEYAISSIKITPLTTVNPFDYARIYTINPYWEVDLSSYVVNVDLQKLRDNYDASLPIGATAANNGTITLDNTTGVFNSYGTSAYAPYMQPDTRLFISLNYQLPDTSSSESVVIGNEMYADSWAVDETSMLASVTFRDYSKFLQESTVEGYISQNTTAGRAIVDILTEAGFPRRRASYLETFRNTVLKTNPSIYFTFQESNGDLTNRLNSGDTKLFIDECGVAYFTDPGTLGPVSSTIVYSELFAVQDDTQRTQTATNIDSSYSPYNQYNAYNPNGSLTMAMRNFSDGYTTQAIPDTGDYSFNVMSFIIDTTVTGGWVIFHDQSNPNISPPKYLVGLQYQVMTATTLKYRIFFTDGAGSTLFATTTNSYTNTKPHMLTVTKTGTTYTLYIDGIADGTATGVVADGDGALVFTDTFTRANSTTVIGGGWTTTVGTWGIISNAAYLATADASGRNATNYNTSDTDHEITFTNGATANDGQGIMVRYVDDSNYIYLVTSNSFGTWNLNKRVAGVSSFIGNVGTVGQTNTTATLRVINNKIYTYIGGVLKRTDTITDSALLTGTKCGLYNSNTTTPASTVTWDNVTINTVKPSTSRFTGGPISNFAVWNRVLTLSEIRAMYVASQQTLIPTYKYLYATEETAWDAMLKFATADVGMFYFDEYGDFKYEYRNALHDIMFTENASQYNLDDNVNIITASHINDVQVNSVKVNINKITPSTNEDQSLWRAESGESLAITAAVSVVTPSSTSITALNLDNPLWPSSGYFKLDNEIIKYESIDGGSKFGSLTRGCFGTKVAWHVPGMFGVLCREARHYEIKYSESPAVSVKYPFITARDFDKKIDIDYYAGDGYSAEVVVSANTNNNVWGDLIILEGTNPLTSISNAFSIAGVPVSSKASQEAVTTVTSSDETSIRRYRKKELVVDSPFIQNKTYAKIVADFILGYYKQPVKILSATVTGIPHLQLGDLVTVTELSALGIVNQKYWVIENTITYDGGVRQELKLHSYVTPITDPESVFVVKKTVVDSNTTFPMGL